MFSIGEFSKMTGLTVKTLRFYHDEGLLVPSLVDPQTRYRYYDESQLELARTIAFLRKLDFPLAEIKALMESRTRDEQILEALGRQKASLLARVAQFKKSIRLLDQFISEERRLGQMASSEFEILEKPADPMTMAGIRMKGRYSDCGKAFGTLGKHLGRYISGKPFTLHYDAEFKEDDADFEACMPIRQKTNREGISIRDLPATQCVSLVHKGGYDDLGRSYTKILKYIKNRGYTVVMPTREVYIKGPGMFFRGNPKNYLTEIQIPIEKRGP